MQRLLGGQVQVLFAATPGTTNYITTTGKLRALAVTMAARAESADHRNFHTGP